MEKSKFKKEILEKNQNLKIIKIQILFKLKIIKNFLKLTEIIKMMILVLLVLNLTLTKNQARKNIIKLTSTKLNTGEKEWI